MTQRHPRYPLRHAELCLAALFIFLAAWAVADFAADMPQPEHIYPDQPSCICPDN